MSKVISESDTGARGRTRSNERTVRAASNAPGRPVAKISSQARFPMTKQVLLVCGILSSALYLAADVYAGSQYPGYSPVSQAFSELLAEGAPTRPFMVAVAGAPYNLLVAALGVGVWASPGRPRVSRITGALLVLYAVISYLGGTVFQMDPRGIEGSVRTTLHEMATAIMVLSMLLAMGFGAFLHGTRFRLYSLGTLLTVLVFAGLSFQQATQLAANEPAPWLGIIERVGIYAWMAWVAVLAVALLRAETRKERDVVDGSNTVRG
jgi:Protein of unknown function (DUF998)